MFKFTLAICIHASNFGNLIKNLKLRFTVFYNIRWRKTPLPSLEVEPGQIFIWRVKEISFFDRDQNSVIIFYARKKKVIIYLEKKKIFTSV